MKKLLSLLAIVPLSMSTVLATTACASTENGTAKVLDTVIKETNLGQITINNPLPIATEIMKFVQQKNVDNTINWNDITVDESTITATSATLISSNTTIYKGEVQLTYKINQISSLDKIIKDTNLGKIKITDGSKIPTKQEIMTKVKEQNSDKPINWDVIDVNESSIDDNSATLISTNFDVYNGTVTVHYEIDSSVALDKVITKTQLGEIITHDSSLPTAEQIIDAAKSVNKDKSIKWDAIKVGPVFLTYEAPLMPNDYNVYTDSVVVTYTVKNITHLNNVVKVNSLGAIKTTDGVKKPTENEIKDAVNRSNKNEDINWDVIKITSITETGAILNSTDESIYIGTVNVDYTVDSSVALDKVIIQTNLVVVGDDPEIIPDDVAVINAAKRANKNPKINWGIIFVITCNETSATLGSSDKSIYTDQVYLTYKVQKPCDLNTLIGQKNLEGHVVPDKNKLPSIKDIMDWTSGYNRSKEIDWNIITVDESTITLTSATLISTGDLYTGQVDLTYFLDSN